MFIIPMQNFINSEYFSENMSDKFLVSSLISLGALLGFTLGYICRFTRPSNQISSKMDETFRRGTSGTVYRMIIGVRSDLKMGKGKVAAQVAHAAVAAYEKALQKAPDVLRAWAHHGQAKITVKLDDEDQMMALARAAKQAGIIVSIIRDAGHTQVEPDTRTVIAFGPARKEDLDKITGHLKLY